MGLKPQDLLILLKYWSLKRAGQASSVRGVAEEIGVSPGEEKCKRDTRFHISFPIEM